MLKILEACNKIIGKGIGNIGNKLLPCLRYGCIELIICTVSVIFLYDSIFVLKRCKNTET